MKPCVVFIAALIAACMFVGNVHADDDVMCAQVITYGLNPETLEWEVFPTPCDVPEGWRSSMTRPDTDPLDPGVITDPANDVDEEPLIISPAPEDIPLIAPYEPDVSCKADYNGDGFVEREDQVGKRRAIKSEFRTWKRKCWRPKKDCGDYNHDGRVDRRDLIGKREDDDRKFKGWKDDCWQSAMRLQSSEANDIGMDSRVSECGGFAAKSEATLDREDDHCRDEKLTWTYDDASQTLTLIDENVWLNCCGKRAVSVSLNKVTGVYEMYETDKPEMTDGRPSRCRCICFFDFQVQVPDVPSENVQVAILRTVAEDKEPLTTVWKGELDLTEAQGVADVQENVGWCDLEPECLDEEICGNGLDDNCNHQVDEGCGEECGGIMGLGCPDGQFCLYPEDTCHWRDHMGVCTLVPDFCIEVYAPVCGCNGKTYANDCFMAMAGQSKMHDGPCK